MPECRRAVLRAGLVAGGLGGAFGGLLAAPGGPVPGGPAGEALAQGGSE